MNDTAPLDPNSLTPADVALLLTKASGTPISEDWILDDLAAGAPTNPDGSIHLVRYAAWLVKEMGNGN